MPSTLTFEAIGTVWQIELFGSLPNEPQQTLRGQLLARIDEFDYQYSRFRADSLVTTMAKTAGTYRLPADAEPLLNLYRHLYDLSGGLVTPLIGQTLASAGYDADYSLKPGIIKQPPNWDDVLDYSFPGLTLKQPALLDFGAAGKGYLVDIVGALLRQHGVAAYCVNAGGDLACYDSAEHTDSADAAGIEVGLEHPADPSKVIGVAKLRNQSLCGSAGNRRAWGPYHHIMNPRTLSSPRHIEALWVVAGDTLTADGLSTALFFMHPDDLAAEFDFEYAIIQADYSLDCSPGFPAEFFVH